MKRKGKREERSDECNLDTRRDVAAVMEESSAERGSDGDVCEKPFQHVDKNWDCSQIEDEVEERDAMVWFEHDEPMGRGKQGRRKDNGEKA